MSGVLATTLLEVYRGTTENALGDEVDNNGAPTPGYGPWVESRRNLVRNPRVASSLADWSFGGGTLTRESGLLGDSGTFARFTRTVPPGTGSAFRVSGMPALPNNGAQIAVRAAVRCSAPLTINVQARYIVTGATPSSVVGTVDLPAGESLLEVAGSSYAYSSSSSSVSGIAFVLATGVPGDIIEATELDVEITPALLPSFIDGDVGGDETTRTRWTGTPGASASVLETRSIIPGYLLTGLPASVIERTKRVQDPATLVWRTIPYLKARMSDPSLDIREGDRVRDLTTGKLMTVDAITRTARSLAGAASLTLDLTDRAA